MLRDNHQRQIRYLRLAVTDRCNLRCRYCMPEQMRFAPRKQLLEDWEIFRLVRLLSAEGVCKLRITGGEPFARPGLIPLLARLKSLDGLERLSLTSNGVMALPYLEELADMGILDLNLSLDSLRPGRFRQITGRDEFAKAWTSVHRALELGFRLKINMVVMEGVNTEEILDFAALAASYPLSVRFIEEMPFNGEGRASSGGRWHYRRILEVLSSRYRLDPQQDHPSSTSLNFSIPGHPGRIGLIPAFSRSFCGTCDRLRVTAKGELKTCLYSQSSLSLRDLIRSGLSDAELLREIRDAVTKKHANGWEAAGARQESVLESMSLIGG